MNNDTTYKLGQRLSNRHITMISIAWLYWWFWVLVIPIEAIAAAEILYAWFPQIPSALYAFAFIILLSSANF